MGSLRSLGHDAVRDARVGRVIELVLDTDDPAEATALAETMCRQLLVNEVVEYGAIELVEADEIALVGASTEVLA